MDRTRTKYPRRLDKKFLENHVRYDEDSPSGLVWNREIYRGKYGTQKFRSIGDMAGTLHPLGYWITKIEDVSYRNHRIICAIFDMFDTGKEPVDHKDRDSSNNKLSNLRVVNPSLNARNRSLSKRNTSGVTGVSIQGKLGREQWMATCHDLAGEMRRKGFSVVKYGYAEAFKLACEYRKRMIEELNAQGAGYTGE